MKSQIGNLHVFFDGVDALLDFFCREMGSGSLLGRRCWLEDVEAIEYSERTLSRLDVRLNVDATGVWLAIRTGIRDGLTTSESPAGTWHVNVIQWSNTYLKLEVKLKDHHQRQTDLQTMYRLCFVVLLMRSMMYVESFLSMATRKENQFKKRKF